MSDISGHRERSLSLCGRNSPLNRQLSHRKSCTPGIIHRSISAKYISNPQTSGLAKQYPEDAEKTSTKSARRRHTDLLSTGVLSPNNNGYTDSTTVNRYSQSPNKPNVKRMWNEVPQGQMRTPEKVVGIFSPGSSHEDSPQGVYGG